MDSPALAQPPAKTKSPASVLKQGFLVLAGLGRLGLLYLFAGHGGFDGDLHDALGEGGGVGLEFVYGL